jgi:hypothetical protein
MTARPARLLRWGAALLAAAAVWAVFAPLIPPLDFGMLWEAGREIRLGSNPYPPLGAPDLGTSHQLVYPYLTALPFVLFGLLPWPVAASLFLAVSIGAVVAAVWLAGYRDPLAAPLVLLAAVTVVGLQIGSLNALFLLGLVLAWRWRDRPWAAGVVLGVCVTAKLFLLPVLGWLLLRWRWRAAAVAAAVPVALVGAGFLVGPIGAGDYLRLLGELSVSEEGKGASVTAYVVAHGLPGPARPLTVALAAGLLGGAWLLGRRGHDERVLYAAGILAALVLSPIVWAHYLVLLAAPLLVAGAGRAALVWFAATAWLLYLPHGVHLTWIPVVAAPLALAAWWLDQRTWWPDALPWAALLATVAGQPRGGTPLAATLWLLLCALWVYRRTAPHGRPGRLNRRDGDDSRRQGDRGGHQVRARGPGGETGPGWHPARAGDGPRR